VYRGRPLKKGDPHSVDLASFWGYRFAIDRAIVAHVSAQSEPRLRAQVRVQPCLNPHLDTEQRAGGVQVVDRQRELFAGFPNVSSRPHIESAEAFCEYLQEQSLRPCDLLYVFCHATAAQTRDELFTFTTTAPDTQSKLLFGASGAGPVDVTAMRELLRGPLSDRPLVFLNACSSVAGDEAFQAPLLWQFLAEWEAAGVIGTDWEVPTVFADAFARRALGYFLRDRHPLGEAFRRASQDAFDQGNPFPLVYAIYARPELSVSAPS
jgi:hypothetical protein